MPVGETSVEGIGREQVWAGGAGMNQPCCCPDKRQAALQGTLESSLLIGGVTQVETARPHLPIWLAVGHEPPPEEHDLDLRAEHNRDEAHSWRS